MNPTEAFKKEFEERVEGQGKNEQLLAASSRFVEETIRSGYSYNFSWMGRPIIQYPQDIVAIQEIIWKVKPDLIVETGIAHGGSLILSASILELIGGDGNVLGIDIDIRDHNKEAIINHPMSKRITMIEGSSIDENIIKQVRDFAKGKSKVLVILDSNHTHSHVLQELKAYAPLVSIDSYLMAFDTIVEDLPKDFDWGARPWGKGNNPKTAVNEFLKDNTQFAIDDAIDNKLLVSVAPGGYLKRIR